MLKLSLQLLLLLLLSYSAYSVLLGWVESPDYPSGYSPHASLNWSRCAPKGHTLSIRLIHLDLEDSQDCENDAVKVYSNGNLISILCGKREFEELQATVNPLLRSSPGGCLSLTFHSDYSNTERHTGFRGFYTVQDFDECQDDPDNGCTQFCHNFIGGYRCSCRHNYHLDADKHTCTVSCNEDLSGQTQGQISSPSWPGSYAENANCKYNLSVDTHLQLELLISDDFDVEQSPDGQCIDGLRVETPSRTLGPFCGNTPPPSPLLTHSNEVQIHFTSDSFGTNKGFSLHFKTRDKVCPVVVAPNSTLTPEQPEYYQGQTVTVTCDVGHEANAQGSKTVSNYAATCQSTGLWTPSYICEPVDCGVLDISEDGILKVVGSNNQRTHYNDQIQFTCISKYYKLEGEDTYTCGASGKWESSGGNTEMPKCIEVCGLPEKELQSTARILGGKVANLGEIPWQLLVKGPKRGGASLINDHWAVTAAHVVENEHKSTLHLYGGLVDGTAANAVNIDTERIIIHPGYARNLRVRTNYDNDIALIRFTNRVNLGPNLIPICLPEGNEGLVENEQGTVSGFGGFERGVVSRRLRHASIGIYSLEQCRDTPSHSSNDPMIFTDNMFCAGAPGKDSCAGDSGSPFVLPMLGGGSGPFRLAGIVSWGQLCEKKEYKGYYTKVENYVQWIKDTIDATEKSLKEEN